MMTTINPGPGEFGIDPPPFRLDDSEFKFKYFWWWFTKDKPFNSCKEQLPKNAQKVEGIFIAEDDLPANGFFLYVNGKFFLNANESPGKFEVTHWRPIDN